jgi:hypothetical protein
VRKTFHWAVTMLSRPGARLVLSHTPRADKKYAIIPRGGAIRDDVAERLLRKKPMVPATPQSWSLQS